MKNVGAANIAKFVLGDGTTSDTFITHTGGNSVADQKFGIGINAYNQFVLDGNGNVGIGTALPDATGFGWNVLTIQGGSSGGEAGVLELKTGAANIVNENLGVIAFLNGSTRVAQIDAISEGSNNTSAINFYTHNNTSMENRLTISSGGDVNIGSADGLP